MSELKTYQVNFINLALESQALEFGKFTLKSGRSSPYFFNAAKMLNGCNLSQLASCYFEVIENLSIKFDCIYGPAYKGIFFRLTHCNEIQPRRQIIPTFVQQKRN